MSCYSRACKISAFRGLALLALAAVAPLSTQAGEQQALAEFTMPQMDLRPLPERSMIEFQSGPLWLLNDETSSDFLLLSNVLTLEGKPHFVVPMGPGKLALGPMVRVLADYFIEGPETYYLGLSGGAVLEYWLPGDETVLYFRPSGGLGLTDAAGEEGDGQGQDFTLNYAFEAGVRHAVTDNISLSLALYFQHFSNGGMTEYNIGYDQMGPMVGISWSF